MLKQVRKNVFETNSSSTHSVTIEKDSLLSEGFPEGETVNFIVNGEHGWEPADFSDVKTKLDYALQDYNYGGDINPVISAVEDFTGCNLKVEFEKSDWGNYNSGYIDHESVGVLRDEIKSVMLEHDISEKEALQWFIFNPNSYLHTDNDNY